MPCVYKIKRKKLKSVYMLGYEKVLLKDAIRKGPIHGILKVDTRDRGRGKGLSIAPQALATTPAVP